MALEKNIKLKVTADTKQAEQNLGKVNKSIGVLSSSISTWAATAGIALGVGFLTKSIQGYVEAERVAAKLSFTLKYNTDRLKEYASELQNTTRFEDDAIINGMALIGIYTKDEETIKRVTKATLDLASAKQMDLGTAFEVMSKAVGGNVGMLKKYNLEIKDTGNKTRDLESALKAINDLMGGSAEAEKNTTYGKIESLKNQIDSLGDSIGRNFAEPLGKVAEWLGIIADTWGGIISGDFGNLENNKAFRDFLGLGDNKKIEMMQSESFRKWRNSLGGGIVGDGGTVDASEIEKRWKLATAAVDEYIEKLVKKTNKEIEGMDLMRKERNRIMYGLTGLKDVGDKPELGFTKDDVMESFYKENSFFIEQLRGDLSILQGEFSNFWNNTFGEANSLLEKLLQNFASGLFELASKSVLSTFLDFIPGGEFLKPFIEGQQRNPQQINLVLDNQVMAKWYVGGKYQAQRLRLD